MTNRRLVLFDIDGTLLHGGRLWRECLERAFAEILPGVPVNRVSFSGKTDRQICREMLDGRVPEGRIPELSEAVLAHYLSSIRQAMAQGRANEVSILPGVRPLVERLAAEPRIHLGLLTGNVREGARLKLQAVGLLDSFRFECGAFGDDHWDRYELPRIAVERAQQSVGLRFRGKQVVLIGDTVHDVKCGQSIGVKAIAVGTGRPEYRDEVLAAGPDHFFETLEDAEGVLQAIHGSPPVIREAGPADDARLGELLVESFVATYARKMPEVVVTEHRKRDLRDVARKREQGAVWVAELGGRIAGTVTLFRPGFPGTRAWLPSTCDLRYMAVDPAFHGLDLAVPLMEAAIAQARAWKAGRICLHVRRGARGLARMYSRFGFVRRPEGDQDQLPEIFLEAYLLEL